MLDILDGTVGKATDADNIESGRRGWPVALAQVGNCGAAEAAPFGFADAEEGGGWVRLAGPQPYLDKDQHLALAADQVDFAMLMAPLLFKDQKAGLPAQVVCRHQLAPIAGIAGSGIAHRQAADVRHGKGAMVWIT